MRIDDEIDRLFQLPLSEFTGERNALAKRAGPQAAAIKSLSKPPIAAWAVNQLYWQKREIYDALIEAAETLRATHAAVMAGRRGDLRAAGKEHDEAIERALKATLVILGEAGHPVTDASRQAIAQTLRALPAADPPGRLTRALQPGGFEALAGMTGGGGRARTPARVVQTPRPAAASKQPASKDEREDRKAREVRKEEAALAKAREEAAVANRELRQAEQTQRRAEFESARAERASHKAGERVAAARANLEAARAELEEADAEATRVERQKQAAQRAVEAAERDLAAAKKRAAAAETQLERLSS